MIHPKKQAYKLNDTTTAKITVTFEKIFHHDSPHQSSTVEQKLPQARMFPLKIQMQLKSRLHRVENSEIIASQGFKSTLTSFVY